MEGKCLGIIPKGNTGSTYIVMYHPKWMNQESEDFLLCWSNSIKDGKGDEGIRTNQFLGKWLPVIVDYREIKE